VPADPLVVLIAVPAEAAAEDAAVDEVAGVAAAACELELLELPHPAMTIAEIANAARPPTLTLAVFILPII
jgi:hypothetical protein